MLLPCSLIYKLCLTGPVIHPMRQPVRLNTFPPEDTVSVRSNMPSIWGRRRCLPLSKTHVSYTSSYTASVSCFLHSALMPSSSACVTQLAVGLCGLLNMISLLLSENVSSSTFMSIRKFGGSRVTTWETAIYFFIFSHAREQKKYIRSRSSVSIHIAWCLLLQRQEQQVGRITTDSTPQE